MKPSKIIGLIVILLCLVISAVFMLLRSDAERKSKETASASVQAEATAAVEATPEVTATPEPTAEPTATPTPEPTATPEPTPDYPQINIDDWQYILANHWNPIGEYTPELVTVENDQQFDSRAADALKEFIAAARAEGLSVYLSSAYRDYNTQLYLYNNKVAQYGEDVAWTIVSVPGTSEHQTGLSADITDRYYQLKDSSLAETALYKWMSAHCQEYGFIVRYPEGKQDITGVIYEPWHFRYVGVEAATYIMEHDITFEEFVAMYKDITWAD